LNNTIQYFVRVFFPKHMFTVLKNHKHYFKEWMSWILNLFLKKRLSKGFTWIYVYTAEQRNWQRFTSIRPISKISWTIGYWLFLYTAL